MSTESPAPPRTRSQPARPATAGRSSGSRGWSPGLALIDAALIGLFLAITFLLGVFPLKDADYYWHLRTGDIIRKTGEIPRVDFYTFTRTGSDWIDLHWVFQVAISWCLEHGGVPALIVAKCVITCLAVALLITARRRTWPVWAVLLAWIPGLLVLSGRMYVRPETLSLLYLSTFLAVITRWDRRPWLAFILPAVQAAWVNSQGLFILGPVLLGFALIDATLRRGAFAPERKGWWQTVIAASTATAAACLLNPYGIRGALYPLELARTMRNPIFSKFIAELTPIPEFIKQAGLGNLPLQLHLLTMALGALSFLVPICWLAWVRIRGTTGVVADPSGEPTGAARMLPPPDGAKKAAPGKKRPADSPPKKARSKKRSKARPEDAEPLWRLSPLRLLLFAAFSLLSWQATRNSHQFAAVVGTVTAWNFAEWVDARRRLAASRAGGEDLGHESLGPRLITMVALIALALWVGTGQFFAMTGEGRRFGWDEEPLFFPHEAVKLAGAPGMPDRFVGFHNAHASVYIYDFSPERPGGPGKTVFTDPRLEVNGPELFHRYLKLENAIADGQPGWESELDAMGRPVVLADHDKNSHVGAAMLANPRWRCVWFDPIAAVFVHQSYEEAARRYAVDFAARHFRPDPSAGPHDTPALIAETKGLRNYVSYLAPVRPDLARQLILIGLDHARRIIELEPGGLDGWKNLGHLELMRDAAARPAPRFKMPFDPVFDLSPARTTYALRKALSINPGDFLSILAIIGAYESRQMTEATLPWHERLVELSPLNQHQAREQAKSAVRRDELAKLHGERPSESWRNLGELDLLVGRLLDAGRAESVADLLERAFPPERAPWDRVDQVATLRLHLGQPELARAAWNKAVDVPRPAVREARIAVTYLVEVRFAEARAAFAKALELDPHLFEAHYGLAVLEQDDGRADPAYRHALAAREHAPDDVSRSAASAIASAVRRFIATAPSDTAPPARPRRDMP